jgi:hypothetical protein
MRTKFFLREKEAEAEQKDDLIITVPIAVEEEKTEQDDVLQTQEKLSAPLNDDESQIQETKPSEEALISPNFKILTIKEILTKRLRKRAHRAITEVEKLNNLELIQSIKFKLDRIFRKSKKDIKL